MNNLILSSEQQALLQWLAQQTAPVSKSGMQQAHAPGYADNRIETMHQEGLLLRTLSVETGELVAVYSPSDKANAILLAQEQLAQQQADKLAQEKRAKKQERFHIFVSYFAGIFSAVAAQLILLWIQRLLNW